MARWLEKSLSLNMNSTTERGSTHIACPNNILQWNSHDINKEKAERAFRVRENLIPVLAFSEGALPGTDIILGYMKYCFRTLVLPPRQCGTLCTPGDPPHKTGHIFTLLGGLRLCDRKSTDWSTNTNRGLCIRESGM